MKLLIGFLFFSISLHAQVDSTIEIQPVENDEEKSESKDDTIYVIGSKEEAFYTPGSAHFIGEKELKTFDYTDIGRVLDKVPGVYIQEEDGLGLRPNIGLRGAHPHRSKKVSLMEDGILIGPSPYSSPAAYYFPSTSRTSNIEVFKGPSSVQYGPNSIGGAVNMISHQISDTLRNLVDLSTGFMNKFEILSSNTVGKTGYVISASEKNGDLVRQIPGANDLEFVRRDIMGKLSFDLTKNGGVKQKLTAKVSYSEEDSDETYMGSGTFDFANNFYDRYLASIDDNVQWNRTAASLKYEISLLSNLKTTSTAYHHDMTRDWYKFNTLAGLSPTQMAQALNSGNRSVGSLLRGDRDSVGPTEELIFGGNDRDYLSQGLQVINKLSLGEEVFHDITFGVRLHRDRITRNHRLVNAVMESGNLRYLEDSRRLGSQTEDESTALTLFLEDEINVGRLTAKIGTRFESVDMTSDPRNGGESKENSTQVFVPGVGLNFSVTDNVSLLAGVNRGVTMVGPGQSNDIEPEESINYEAGLRIKGAISLEAVGFYSDYSNIKGVCSFSSGCDEADLDTEFNGGAADVYGLESSFNTIVDAGNFSFPVNLNYTFTQAEFKTSFISDNSEWGLGQINPGDPLPYIPRHQVSLGLGMNYKRFSTNMNVLYKDQVADQAVSEGRIFIPSYVVTDLSVSYRYGKESKIYVRADNIFGNDYITSLKPFGLRPGKIRSFTAGLRHVF